MRQDAEKPLAGKAARVARATQCVYLGACHACKSICLGICTSS